MRRRGPCRWPRTPTSHAEMQPPCVRYVKLACGRSERSVSERLVLLVSSFFFGYSRRVHARKLSAGRCSCIAVSVTASRTTTGWHHAPVESSNTPNQPDTVHQWCARALCCGCLHPHALVPRTEGPFVPVLSMRLPTSVPRLRKPGNCHWSRRHDGGQPAGHGGDCDAKFRRKRERSADVLAPSHFPSVGSVSPGQRAWSRRSLARKRG